MAPDDPHPDPGADTDVDRLLDQRSAERNALLQATADGVSMFDSDRRLVLVNQGFLDLFDYPAELARPGTPLEEFMRHRAARERGLSGKALDEYVRDRIRDYRAYWDRDETVTLGERGDGRIVEVRRRTAPGGYLVSTYTDVTDHQAIRERMEQSESRYRAVVEDQTELICRLNTDFQITFANHAYRAFILPDLKDEHIPPDISPFRRITDMERRKFLVDRMNALTVDDPVDHSVFLEENVGTGNFVWQEWTNRALFDEGGNKTGYQCIGRDVTRQVLAESALKSNLKLQSAIIASALDGVLSIDEEGLVREFNPAAERMFGFGRGEIIGKPLADAIIPRRHLSSGLGGLLGNRAEITGLRDNGEEFPLEIALVDVHDEKQDIFVAFLRDLSEQKAMEEEVERQRNAVAQGNKLSALGALLANVAHELNNPLSVVIGQTDLLSELADDEPTRERALKIKAAADRCASIVRNFLAMARQRPVSPQLFDAGEAVRQALTLVTHAYQTSGVVLDTDVAPGLPPVHGDCTQISQILVNLLVNAQQAVARNQDRRHVTLAAAARNGAVVFTVDDNGPGITGDDRDRVFEPFFSTKPEGEGTGIGLAIAHTIAEAHGGSLTLEESNGGARFVLRLPRAPDNVPQEDADDRKTPQAAAGLTVLVVDDEPDVAATLVEILESLGCRVDQVHAGADAIAALSEATYDLVVSDLRMPNLDGPRLYRRAVAKWPALADRFAFITGDSLSHSMQAFLKESGRPFIEKPFVREDITELLATLPGPNSA